jgi:hypothetical protein
MKEPAIVLTKGLLTFYFLGRSVEQVCIVGSNNRHDNRWECLGATFDTRTTPAFFLIKKKTFPLALMFF